MQERLSTDGSSGLPLTLNNYRVKYCKLHNTANHFFHSKDYQNAIGQYLEGINLYSQMGAQFKLEDFDYRSIIELYIDLSDAYYHSLQKTLGDEACWAAVKVFSYIKDKSPEEKAIGDPRKNFQLFHRYFEKRCSDPSYLQSIAFKAHENTLNNAHEEKQLLSGLAHLDVSSENDSKQPAPVGVTSFSLPAFVPMSDDDYRAIADGFIQQVQVLLQDKKMDNLPKTTRDAIIIAYQETVRALTHIQNKNKKDANKLQELQKEILLLQVPSSSLPSQVGVYSQSQTAQASGSQSVSQLEETEEDIIMGVNNMTLRG
jgi:hypothetical protein